MNAFVVGLLPAKFADEQMEQALAAADGNVRHLAYAIVQMLHSRHVAITPALACDLAEIATSTTLRSDNYPAPWNGVMQRLTDSLRQMRQTKGDRRSEDRQPFIPLRLNAAFSYTILRLVAPLIDRACRTLNPPRAFLFCEDEDGLTNSISDVEYRLFADELGRRVTELASQEDAVTQRFWQETALLLVAATRRPGLLPTQALNNEDVWDDHHVLPLVSPAKLALLLRLTAPSQDNRQDQRDLLINPTPHLFDVRRREAGIDGIYATRRPEDLRHMLPSELIKPPLLLLNSLVNSGFLAARKPPRPIRLRDMLVVGAYAGGEGNAALQAFVQACWFEFVLQLSRLLQAHDLVNSEVRWIAADRLQQRMTTKAMVVRRLSLLPAGSKMRDEMYRQQFLLQLGWLPGFLDEHAYYESPAETRYLGGQVEVDPTTRRAANWLHAAWRAQRELLDWRQADTAEDPLEDHATGFSKELLQIDQFAHVHVMVFVPRPAAGNAGGDPRAVLRCMVGALRLPSGGSVALVGLPHSLSDAPQATELTPDDRNAKANHWLFTGARRGASFAPEAKLDKLAGKLTQAWLENVIEELRYG